MRFFIQFSFVATLAAALVAASSQAARAQVSVDGGYFETGGTGSVGAAVSLQLFKTPVIPLSVEATAAAPFDGHGFAATADARFKLGGTTLGAGVGAGNIGQSTLGQSRFLVRRHHRAIDRAASRSRRRGSMSAATVPRPFSQAFA